MQLAKNRFAYILCNMLSNNSRNIVRLLEGKLLRKLLLYVRRKEKMNNLRDE